jgi:hypothetical protein
MPISIHASCRDSDARMYELGSAIANRLHVDYMPALAEPLPRELKGLIARLVALEESPAGAGLLQEGETTSSVLPRFERSCGRPTNRVLAKAANLPISFCACNSGLPDLQLVAYRLGNFALRLVAVILAIRADGRNYMFSVEWTPVASKEYVNVT